MPRHAVFPSPSLQLLQLDTMQEISGNAKQDNATQHVPRDTFWSSFPNLIEKYFFKSVIRHVDCFFFNFFYPPCRLWMEGGKLLNGPVAIWNGENAMGITFQSFFKYQIIIWRLGHV